MEQFSIFERFKLNNLNADWINAIWDEEFLTFTDQLPNDYYFFIQRENLEKLLMETCSIIKSWILNKNNEVKWQTLNSFGINVRGLLAFLGYVMNSGQKIGSDEDSRQCCLRACSLYFMLLAVPGSSVYQVFHPNLYYRAMETFKLANLLAQVPKNANKSLELEDIYDNIDEPIESLAHSEQVTLIKSLNCIMFDLIKMLGTFYMKDKPETLNITVQSLTECSKLETNFNHFQSHNKVKDASLTSLSYNAYIALQELCDSNHGSVDLTIQLIAKYALPHLSATYNELPQKALVIVQETTINFFQNLLNSRKNEAETGILILLQHLMMNCPERLEARQKQATVVTKLINICNDELYLKAIETLILFAHHNKVTCRIFAQEIISKCLLENVLNREGSRLKAKKILISTSLGRCVDSSSLEGYEDCIINRYQNDYINIYLFKVRGRAMSIIATCTEIDNSNRIIFQDIFDESREMETFPPTIEMLKNSIHDEIDPLPSAIKVYSMLKERLEDERALVRRSALQILKNVASLFPETVDQVFLSIGLRCRDPTLTVRSFAIQVLTHLLLENVENSILIDYWIRFVLPQVYDIEPKVQEKALESLESLILKNIKTFSEDNATNVFDLPWLIIDKLTKEKMRKHLSKACELWKKSDLLSKLLVTKIKSHIDTKNNISAWALLAAFSENIQLPSMDQYFRDYSSLLRGKDFCARLKLEVLRNSWHLMNQNFLHQFYEDLHKSLSKFEVNLALISICFDMLTGIARKLEEETETKMQELMRLCEIQIEKIFRDKEEALEAESIYIKAMCTLGHAAFLSSSKTSILTIRTLQGLLLQWESIPQVLQTRKEMQATAIVLLGQLAMRDREIAEETMPIFGKLMSKPVDAKNTTESWNKINSAKTLADLCIRFTALVESYLPDMCVSMKDPNPLVREVIVVIFIQLLLEDFIKIKGPFFFHILTMLTDDDETIRELTIFLIKERLLSKNKTLVSQQFIKSIFHYNNCQVINKFAIQTMREREKKALTLQGKENDTKRRIIYDFMLEHLDPPGKLKLICKMTSEILGRMCDNALSIKSEPEVCMLRDVLYLLASEQLQVSNKQSDDDSQEDVGNVTVNSNSKAIHEIIDGIKRHKLEVLLPVIVKLKKKLALVKSILLPDVTRFFLKIVADYNKEQLSNLYNEYPNLDKDIEADTRKYGKRAQNDDDDDDDDDDNDVNENNGEKEERMRDAPFRNRKERNLKNILSRNPRIVLRRLSSLTYQNAMGSNSSIDEIDDFIPSPEPGPSCSSSK